MSTIKISRADFTKKVKEGWKRDQLMEHYNIKSSDVTSILKTLNLSIRRFHKPRFELVDDVEETTNDSQVEEKQVVSQPKEEITSEPVEEKKPVRKRRTKAEIEADKAKEEAEKVLAEGHTPIEKELLSEDSSDEDIEVATGEVETNFNIPTGVDFGKIDDSFAAQPINPDELPKEENPFAKAWGK